MKKFQKPESFFKAAWQLLEHALKNPKDPLRLLTFGTTDEKNFPTTRTVVLRKVRAEKAEIDVFADLRSPKIQNLSRIPKASLVFYHPELGMQIRALAEVTLINNNEESRDVWKRLPIEGRKNYGAEQAPGTPLESGHDGLPPSWKNNPSLKITEPGFKHFVILRCQLEEIDCLLLHPEGHQRAVFKQKEEEWQGSWVVP